MCDVGCWFFYSLDLNLIQIRTEDTKPNEPKEPDGHILLEVYHVLVAHNENRGRQLVKRNIYSIKCSFFFASEEI